MIKTLVKGVQEAGKHSVVWQGKDNSGKEVSSGIYFYKFKTEDIHQTRKMILMK
jgi:flagellar hook assembly protein FlgD